MFRVFSKKVSPNQFFSLLVPLWSLIGLWSNSKCSWILSSDWNHQPVSHLGILRYEWMLPLSLLLLLLHLKRSNSNCSNSNWSNSTNQVYRLHSWETGNSLNFIPASFFFCPFPAKFNSNWYKFQLFQFCPNMAYQLSWCICYTDTKSYGNTFTKIFPNTDTYTQYKYKYKCKFKYKQKLAGRPKVRRSGMFAYQVISSPTDQCSIRGVLFNDITSFCHFSGNKNWTESDWCSFQDTRVQISSNDRKNSFQVTSYMPSLILTLGCVWIHFGHWH